MTRAVRTVVLAPPLARAGYLYATAVASAGASFSPPEGSAGSTAYSCARACHRGPSAAEARASAGVYLTDDNAKPAVLEHEAVHRQQWKTYGMVFPVLYFFAGRDP